jgi:hypothetical protein
MEKKEMKGGGWEVFFCPSTPLRVTEIVLRGADEGGEENADRCWARCQVFGEGGLSWELGIEEEYKQDNKDEKDGRVKSIVKWVLF